MSDYTRADVIASPVYQPRFSRQVSDPPDQCVKCGSINVRITHRSAGCTSSDCPLSDCLPEHLMLTCQDCRFTWPNRCTDTKDAQ